MHTTKPFSCSCAYGLRESYKASLVTVPGWLVNEAGRPVRALQSLSGAFITHGASATPPCSGIVYGSDPRLVVRNCKLQLDAGR